MSTKALQIIKSENKEVKFYNYCDGSPDELGEQTLNICSRFKDWIGIKSIIKNIVIIESNYEEFIDVENELRDFLIAPENVVKHYNPPAKWDKNVCYKYIIDLDNNCIEFYYNTYSDDNDNFKLFFKTEMSNILFYYDFDKFIER